MSGEIMNVQPSKLFLAAACMCTIALLGCNDAQNKEQKPKDKVTINENPYVIGSGTVSLNHVLPTANYNGKSQYLFTATELLAAGMSAGNLDGLMLQVLNGTESADFLRVKIKSKQKFY